MTTEPPPLPASVFAPGKEAEIAELTQKAANASMLTATLMETMQNLFAALPSEKQMDVLVQFTEQMKKKDARLYEQVTNKINYQGILSVAGSLKNHPAHDDYARILKEQREERRKDAELLYPDEREENVG